MCIDRFANVADSVCSARKVRGKSQFACKPESDQKHAVRPARHHAPQRGDLPRARLYSFIRAAQDNGVPCVLAQATWKNCMSKGDYFSVEEL